MIAFMREHFDKFIILVSFATVFSGEVFFSILMIHAVHMNASAVVLASLQHQVDVYNGFLGGLVTGGGAAVAANRIMNRDSNLGERETDINGKRPSAH